MAYGDYGSLLPGQATYRGPGQQFEVDRQAALQKGSYLSSMDQFYEQLEESTRQFDLSYGLQERQVSLAEEHDVWSKDVAYQGLELQGEQLQLQEELGWGQINAQYNTTSQQGDYQTGMLDLAEREFALKEQDYYSTAAFEDFYAPQFADAALSSYQPSSSTSYGSSSQAITPESLGIYTPGASDRSISELEDYYGEWY